MVKKFAGKNMHIEYHTVDPKKKKAADCIYLTTDRICRNKHSYYYLSKSFDASNCCLRVKEKDVKKPAQINQPKQSTTVEKKPQIKSIKCTLPKRCPIYSEAYGKGKFVGYNELSMIISVQFGTKIRPFQYPGAITQKYLILPKFAFERVLYDISKAEKG